MCKSRIKKTDKQNRGRYVSKVKKWSTETKGADMSSTGRTGKHTSPLHMNKLCFRRTSVSTICPYVQQIKPRYPTSTISYKLYSTREWKHIIVVKAVHSKVIWGLGRVKSLHMRFPGDERLDIKGGRSDVCRASSTMIILTDAKPHYSGVWSTEQQLQCSLATQ